MTITPRDVFARGRPCSVEQTRLRKQNKRILAGFVRPGHALGLLNLLQSAPQMHGSCSCARFRLPRDRSFQSPINFANAWAITITLELLPELAREYRPCNSQELA